MKIAMVADSHLAPDAHTFNRNWAAVRAFVEETRADFIRARRDVYEP